jgi:hypothetical protein
LELKFYTEGVKSGSVVKTVIVHLRTPAEVGESEYIILENSTDFSINHLILDADAGSPNDTSVMKILSEDSFDSSMAGIKTRITTTPGAVDVIASDDFGYSQTVEYFDDTIDNNPTTGLDVNL